MIKVGLTGGIGSGKTAVAKIWEELGASPVYADDLAKRIMTDDPNVKGKIIELFGDASYNSDGSLNRPYLAKEAFEKGKVEELNGIVHPAVFKETKKLFEDAEKKGYKCAFKEAALLLKQGRPADLDVIVFVDADEEIRMQRVMQRDGVSRQEVQHRMAKQNDVLKKDLCDIIIENNRTEEELRKKAVAVYRGMVTG